MRDFANFVARLCQRTAQFPVGTRHVSITCAISEVFSWRPLRRARRRPAVRPVARSGDHATTWSLAARIPGRYSRPIPKDGRPFKPMPPVWRWGRRDQGADQRPKGRGSESIRELIDTRARTSSAFLYLQYATFCNQRFRESGASDQNMIFSSKLRCV